MPQLYLTRPPSTPRSGDFESRPQASVATQQQIRPWSTMECSQMAAWTSNQRRQVASSVKAFCERPTNPTRLCLEIRPWKATVFFSHQCCRPCLAPPLTVPLGRGHRTQPRTTSFDRNKSMPRDVTPIICSTCLRHFHRTRSRLTRS